MKRRTYLQLLRARMATARRIANYPANRRIKRAMLEYERWVISVLRRDPHEVFQYPGHRVSNAIDRLERKGALRWKSGTGNTAWSGRYILNPVICARVMRARA